MDHDALRACIDLPSTLMTMLLTNYCVLMLDCVFARFDVCLYGAE